MCSGVQVFSWVNGQLLASGLFIQVYLYEFTFFISDYIPEQRRETNKPEWPSTKSIFLLTRWVVHSTVPHRHKLWECRMANLILVW